MTSRRGVRLCPCGRRLHYPNTITHTFLLRQIRQYGATAVIQTADGPRRVSRHFLALHPRQTWELSTRIARLGSGADHARAALRRR